MIWRLLLLGLLLWSSCVVHAKTNSTDDQVINDLIDIDGDNDGADSEASGKGPVETFEDMEGSGTDDDEELGSGEGSGMDVHKKTYVITEGETPRTPLTPCQNLRQSSIHLRSYVPQCTTDGAYEKRQCQGLPKYEQCWCVDPNGIEISGTMMNSPDEPDCDHGVNLKECIFQYLQHSHGLFGEYRPQCTFEGDFEQVQCHERECWCVRDDGLEIQGTRTRAIKGLMSCSDSSETTVKTTLEPIAEVAATTTKKHSHDHQETQKPKDTRKGYDVKETHKDDVTVILPGEGGEIDEGDTDAIYDDKEFVDPEDYSAVHIMKQPGLLAAIIGGAVVGLLMAILLVMFIVYRMRKKDEGSYALDEPHQKYQNYSYTKAPDKEFYA